MHRKDSTSQARNPDVGAAEKEEGPEDKRERKMWNTEVRRRQRLREKRMLSAIPIPTRQETPLRPKESSPPGDVEKNAETELTLSREDQIQDEHFSHIPGRTWLTKADNIYSDTAICVILGSA
ncbi:hypothetical protein NDU88_006807 [Pleurodeles waltl]|uniref:Uncharacterized protein n=1 Tax=Pleurodeles waltl TaxID=8319 RepID=A0AAV7ML22_PLEWA|nr:hypothetical protein NDU88_006807 [Pleurodeles waltl]